MIRNGYLATWQNTEYEASPGPDGTVRLYSATAVPGFEAIGQARYRRVVPQPEVTSVHYVRTRCEWRGQGFVVIGEHSSWLRVELLGEDPTVAQRLDLERYEMGVYQGWAPRAEVTGLREELLTGG